MSKLTKLIKGRRKLLKVSQAELATSLGFSNGQFSSNVERGVCEWPPKYYKKISKLLRLDLKDLMKAALEDYSRWLKKSL